MSNGATVWSDLRIEQSYGELSGVRADDNPEACDICHASALEGLLARRGIIDYALIASGDIMLGDRTTPLITQRGADYPFAGVLPLLNRSRVVLGNLEGPFASKAPREERNHSYKVDPNLASALGRANINVVTLANNHLLDCGRDGVLETLDALEQAGIHAIGAGRDEQSAHAPAVLDIEGMRIGLLGYYWNERTAATRNKPGSAVDTLAWLKADINALHDLVDRVVVTFHWGVPYERVPSLENREKARLAIDLGADLVIGHHPHIIQPIEIYKNKAIFYSVGNFAFGSGNSKAESILVGVRFDQLETVIDVYPVYVRNRDPRVNYQPKILTGEAGRRILEQIKGISDESGGLLHIDAAVGRLELPGS